MFKQIFPVILSGGVGSRLWPLSRETYPKQLIALVDEYTLLQNTARRLPLLENIQPPIVVCNNEHRFTVAEQLSEIAITPATIILEPVARNTAPAIAAAALEILSCHEGDYDPILLVMPSDHFIGDIQKFENALRQALCEAVSGRLVTFGVTPTHADTSYGYIKVGHPTGNSEEGQTVTCFVEKPDIEEADSLIQTSSCYWNSGIFLFGAKRYLKELCQHAAAIYDAVRLAHQNAKYDIGFLRLDKNGFIKSPSTSVDYAVMEHTTDAVVVPLGTKWSDVGSWASLAKLSKLATHDETGNVTQGDVVLYNTQNTYIHGESRLISAVGVSDLIIIDTADAVLVADKQKSQDVSKVVDHLKKAGREEYRIHRKVYRPWGYYELLHESGEFKVKRILINSGQQLSLQSHQHRAEHWIVVRGKALVTRGEEIFTLAENESTYIPKGTRHRLENSAATPLELIEVQSGSYLGEDDIFRFEDNYGRTGPDA